VTAALTLAGHSLRRARGLALSVGLVVCGFQVLATILAQTFQESNAFGQIAALVPPVVRQAFGASVLTVLSFQGIVCLGYIHPIVIGAVLGVVMATATEPAGEIERRFVDLILARAVPRSAVVTRSVVVMLVAAVVLTGLLVLGTWLGLVWFAAEPALWPPGRVLGALSVNLAALSFCWGGLTLAAAVRARRRAVAGSLAGLAAFATFLLDYVARVWAPARRIAWISPFHYYDPTALLLGVPLNLTHIWTLIGTGLAGIAIAHVIFSRRDV
jgi:ABC-2 type transport system permease protein